jgi:aminoglycoside 6'-N-acetyltransferase
VVLRDGEVVLREIEARDLDPLLAMIAMPGVAEWWGPLGDREHEVEGLLNAQDGGAFAIEVAGELAGWLGYNEELEPNYRHASLDIFVAPELQNRGVGRAALRLAIGWLTGECGHHRLTIDPAARNARAIHVYESVGFRPVGILRRQERGFDGTWHDALLMDLLAEDLAPDGGRTTSST